MWREWRVAALGGLAAGLALSPLCARRRRAGARRCRSPAPPLLLVATRPCGRGAAPALDRSRRPGRDAGGGLLGAARVRALDAGAFRGEPDRACSSRGHVAAVPRRSGGVTRVEAETAERAPPDRGRRASCRSSTSARRCEARGHPRSAAALARADPRAARDRRWFSRTDAIDARPGRRGGLAGRLDAFGCGPRRRSAPGSASARRRWPAASSSARTTRSTPPPSRTSAAPASPTCWRSAGRTCSCWCCSRRRSSRCWACRCVRGWPGPLALIAVYVPLAGGGPSIQRAGVMGAAGLVAVSPGAPRSRLYALLLAAAVTLALNPRASGDVGWQLSFAAVAGIFVLAGPLRDAILGAGRRRFPGPPRASPTASPSPSPRRWRRRRSAPTISSTVPVTTLAANLAALPAVAPAMWLGMVAAALGQLPWAPVEQLNWLNERLLAYIAEVAAAFAAPDWSVADVGLGSPPALAAAYGVCSRSPSARCGSRPSSAPARARRSRRRRAVGSAPGAGRGHRAGRGPADRIGRAAGGGRRRRRSCRSWAADQRPRRRPGRRDPARSRRAPRRCSSTPARRAPSLAQALEERGVHALAAVALTHDQSDHGGGLAELAGRIPVDRFALRPRRPARSRPHAAAAGAVALPVARGDVIRVGRPAARRALAAALRSPAAAAGSRTRTPPRWSCSPAGAASRCC